jgi:hypothetical protein
MKKAKKVALKLRKQSERKRSFIRGETYVKAEHTSKKV